MHHSNLSYHSYVFTPNKNSEAVHHLRQHRHRGFVNRFGHPSGDSADGGGYATSFCTALVLIVTIRLPV
jgi:hypothetical protein